jgi:lipoate-protein ligase A
MAIDFLLLQRYPRAAAPRFRHYEWRAPAFTFGYAQQIAFVREQLPAGTFDLCRRPTGGGIVDHREDWTYALVIPRGHALEESRATQSYRAVHEALTNALRDQHVPAFVKSAVDETEDNAAGICFERAEIYDVVHEISGAKIAGAAQKRNKHGLLFQGSIGRRAVADAALDWEKFEAVFVTGISSALNVPAQAAPWPELDDDEVGGLTEQYSSAEWIERR